MTIRMTNSEVDGVSVVTLDGRIVLGEESNSFRENIRVFEIWRRGWDSSRRKIE
jgi:hypothetical protein